jgi:hypothetical protein
MHIPLTLLSFIIYHKHLPHRRIWGGEKPTNLLTGWGSCRLGLFLLKDVILAYAPYFEKMKVV